MKTIRQHLLSMPSPYGQMAIEETINQGYKHELKDPEPSLYSALLQAFIWSRSELGISFWGAVADNAKYLEAVE